MPPWARVINGPQMYVYTKIRTCEGGIERGFGVGDQSRKVMGGAEADCGVMKLWETTTEVNTRVDVWQVLGSGGMDVRRPFFPTAGGSSGDLGPYQ